MTQQKVEPDKKSTSFQNVVTILYIDKNVCSLQSIGLALESSHLLLYLTGIYDAFCYSKISMYGVLEVNLCQMQSKIGLYRCKLSCSKCLHNHCKSFKQLLPWVSCVTPLSGSRRCILRDWKLYDRVPCPRGWGEDYLGGAVAQEEKQDKADLEEKRVWESRRFR